jgi:hypothetical protein
MACERSPRDDIIQVLNRFSQEKMSQQHRNIPLASTRAPSSLELPREQNPLPRRVRCVPLALMTL